jgi:hypothetical protein
MIIDRFISTQATVCDRVSYAFPGHLPSRHLPKTVHAHQCRLSRLDNDMEEKYTTPESQFKAPFYQHIRAKSLSIQSLFASTYQNKKLIR